MDKSLNSSPKVPWWLILLQTSPLIIQLIGEILSRTQSPTSVLQSGQETSDLSEVSPSPNKDMAIPGPL